LSPAGSINSRRAIALDCRKVTTVLALDNARSIWRWAAGDTRWRWRETDSAPLAWT
jgi:hypothetical protein